MTHQFIIGFPKFFEVREWCWTTFGPGVEYEHWINHSKVTKLELPWAWNANKFQGASRSSGHIYVATDDMKTQLMLTWHE